MGDNVARTHLVPRLDRGRKAPPAEVDGVKSYVDEYLKSAVRENAVCVLRLGNAHHLAVYGAVDHAVCRLYGKARAEHSRRKRLVVHH